MTQADDFVPETYHGFCHACQSAATFTATGPWYRDTLRCGQCRSVVRERAVAMKLTQLLPQWRSAAIHEVAPVNRAFVLKLRAECPGYVTSHWFPDQPAGRVIHGYRNENIEAQSFGDAVFDCVLSLDVMEHIFHPEAAYREIHRTLKPGGLYIHTFPIKKSQLPAVIDRAALHPDGSITHLLNPPEYHGNPIDAKGSLVTKDYGHAIVRQIAEWAPFDVEICRFWDRTHGLMGDFSDVVICRKPDLRFPAGTAAAAAR